MGFGSPKPPSLSMPPPMAHPPTLGSTQIALAGLQARQRALAAEGEGDNSTVETGPEGLQEQANTAKSTLLGK